jgi:hypothetical protein
MYNTTKDENQSVMRDMSNHSSKVCHYGAISAMRFEEHSRVSAYK